MRHAQEHWLNLQAKRAIADALVIPDNAEEWATSELETIPEGFTELDILEHLHGLQIMDARIALGRAEVLHREIVRRGGKV